MKMRGPDRVSVLVPYTCIGRSLGPAHTTCPHSNQAIHIWRLQAKVFQVGRVPTRVTVRGPPPPSMYLRVAHSRQFRKNITTFAMASTEPPSTPPSQRFKNPDLTCDERLQVQTLRKFGLTYEQIVAQLGLTFDQVGHACCTANITPKKRSGRPSLLNAEQIIELITFVTSSKASRRMPYAKIPLALDWNCSEYAICYALCNAGFKHYVAY